MQVFITSKSYEQSAKQLDIRRLNKQIIECNQIYKAIVGDSAGWKNHCVTRLWTSYANELMYFAGCCYTELKNKGYNPCMPLVTSFSKKITPTPFMTLNWWTSAMQSHLLAKDFAYYSKFGWTVVSGYYALDANGDWKKYSMKI
jgi:hypothetical protein